MLRFPLAYFSWCDCSWVVIFPSRHLSPCQHGEAHCRQYPCLWIHIDDALLLSCDSPPLLTTIGFSLQPRVGFGPFCIANCVLCIERDPSVFVCGRKSVGCPVIIASMIGRKVCWCCHMQMNKLCSTSKRHLHFFLFLQKKNFFFFKDHLCEYSCLCSL